jgi:hypothetical protein
MVARRGSGKGYVDAVRAAPALTSGLQPTRRRLCGRADTLSGAATKRAVRASAVSAGANARHEHHSVPRQNDRELSERVRAVCGAAFEA